MRFAYTLAPDYAQSWLDGYVDFDATQAEAVRDQIGQFFRWHRGTQLPVYAKFLARARAEVNDNITPATACKWYAEGMGFVRPAIDHALPMAAGIVRGFTPRQVQHLERKYQKANANFRETYLQPSLKERREASLARTVKRAESLYGSLEAGQKERLAQGLDASPFDPEVWLAERMRRQQEAVKTLRRLASASPPPTAEPVQVALRQLVEHVLSSPEAGYRAYQERLMQHNCALAAQLHNSTSREQRDTAAARLKGWEEDFLALAKGAARRN